MSLQRLDSGTPELAQKLEGIEAEAWLDWLAAAPPSLAERLGLTSFRVGGAVAGATRSTDVLMYNRVVGLGMTQPATHEHVDELITRYSATGVARWMIQWSPNARPAVTLDLLRACGFYHHNNWIKLYRRADAALSDAPTPLRVERVGGEHRDTFAAILEVAFGHERQLTEWSASLVDRPGWRAYMAFSGDTPVGTGALFVQGRAAWLGFGATHPSYRGRGAQSALLVTRLRAAQELGCEIIVAETAEDRPGHPAQSYRNLERLGFQVAYARPNYVMIRGTAAAGVILERPLFG